MRRPPPAHAKGTPRTPGSGRRRGTPNRKTVELRQLMGILAGDIEYQERFSRAFRQRRLHPSTEQRVWEYAIGKPKEQIEMSAKLSMDARLAAERELFAQLDITQLEALAAESQALVDKALAMVQAQRPQPAGAMLPRAALNEGTTTDHVIDARADTHLGVDEVKAGQPPIRFEGRTSAAAARPPFGCAVSADSADSSDETVPNGLRIGDGEGDR